MARESSTNNGKLNRENAMRLVDDLEIMEEKVREMVEAGSPYELVDARTSIIDAKQRLDKAILQPTKWGG